jgi:hypothetical protein
LSKEVAVFALIALMTYSFFEFKLITALKHSIIILVGSALTVIVGFESYDHYFTTFPNFASHIEYLINYAKSVQGYYVSTNPGLWLTSLTSRDLGTGLGVINPLISFPVFVWIPLLILYIGSRRSAHALTLPAVLLFWTYFPYFVLFDYLHRDVKYLYSIQMTPALALGAAYLYSMLGEKLTKWKKKYGRILNVALMICIISFAISLHYFTGTGSNVSSTSQNSQSVAPPSPPFVKYKQILNSTSGGFSLQPVGMTHSAIQPPTRNAVWSALDLTVNRNLQSHSSVTV